MNNPFTGIDKNKEDIWDMVVKRDIEAFVNQDWKMVEDDFHEEGFMGIDGGKSQSIDQWKLSFPNLESYKISWLQQAKEFHETSWGEDVTEALHRVTILQDIEIIGDAALLHKKFVGDIKKADGSYVETNWQTLYRCRKINGQWKMVGFTGYLPFFSVNSKANLQAAKQMPANASQHVTAGPYSPVLEVNPSKLVVISGQAAIDKQGNVIGDTIEEQTVYMMDNCSIQLASAGCTLNDVFKVNVFIKDLADWPRFNAVYKNYFKDPKPVRTAVQTGLLMNLVVEIEMWAAKK
ncbi:Rid family hydrolase [Aestuariivivens sp. NBU2969]|uniref:Rid family hydrolase n=1 Tax=Aestuariivivens sp. NBU2969 TaxID=2873267 RepID=UPI001CBACE89|nr:Rid family hydrolase [Aestuariivivens sp. NBU2969]